MESHITFIIIEAILCLMLFGKGYVKEKGKNIATKEDIADITSKIEDVKLEFKNQHEVEKQKRQLKYDAIIQSLTILDAHFSQLMNPNKNQKIKLQFINTEDVRKCHNSLILSCENVELINLFSKILIGAIATPSPMELLNVYRNLVRTELGFGSTLDLDNDIVFFTFVPFDNDLNGEYKYDSSK